MIWRSAAEDGNRRPGAGAILFVTATALHVLATIRGGKMMCMCKYDSFVDCIF